MNKKERELTLKHWANNRLTIYDVKRLVTNARYYFSRGTMRTFNQTLKDFHVNKTCNPEVYHLWAYSIGSVWALGSNTKHVSERYFNVINNKFYDSQEDAEKGE